MSPERQRPTVRLITFGCRVNQYETQMMYDRLAPSFDVAEDKADLVVVNGCTVTSLAERKARQAIRRVRRANPQAKVVVVGCLGDAAINGLTRIEDADVLAGNYWKERIADVAERTMGGHQGILAPSKQGTLQEEKITRWRGHVRAFVKVQDGCDLSCTFCRTTQVRGKARSKPVARAVTECVRLVEGGCPEIVLVGINLAQYNPPDGDLAELVERLLDSSKLRRLRLGSINPTGITKQLVATLASDERICPYFHIPLQSGDDSVLASMHRGYDSGYYLSRIALVRTTIPEATFGADVMVGFPGEGEAAFARTRELIRKVGFANLHIFRYSPRPGTHAANLPHSLPERTKRDRSRQVEELAREILERIHSDYMGSKRKLLIENRRNGQWRGYTRTYIDTYVRSGNGLCPGAEVDVRIDETSGSSLGGVIENREYKG